LLLLLRLRLGVRPLGRRREHLLVLLVLLRRRRARGLVAAADGLRDDPLETHDVLARERTFHLKKRLDARRNRLLVHFTEMVEQLGVDKVCQPRLDRLLVAMRLHLVQRFPAGMRHGFGRVTVVVFLGRHPGDARQPQVALLQAVRRRVRVAWKHVALLPACVACRTACVREKVLKRSILISWMMSSSF